MRQDARADVRAVANFILDHADGVGAAVTNRALSEITYIILGWRLAKAGHISQHGAGRGRLDLLGS